MSSQVNLGGMSATQQARGHASRAADSKPLEYLVRGGFVMYGVIHLLIAWLALQVALGGSSKSSDQSGALQDLASKPFGKALLVITIIGLVALAIWQGLEAAIGQSGQTGKEAI